MPSHRNVYHMDLDKEKIQGAKFALLPGDPFRSESIAENIARNHKTKAYRLAWKREYCTYLTDIEGIKILVSSTGIGGSSASIAIDELAQIGVRTFIRVGTTGAIQPNINIGDVIITSGSVRLDGASNHYAPIEYPAVAHHEVLFALIKAAKDLQNSLKNQFRIGITISSDTFYPGQERYDSFSKYVPRRFKDITKEWKKLKALNYEMESATVLTLCSTFGLRGGCVTGIIVNRTKEEKITKEALALGENNAIQVAIKAMYYLISKKSKIK